MRARANAIEHFLKSLLKFLAAIGTVREFARVEDGGIVCEEGAELVPIKIVECLDESRRESCGPRLRHCPQAPR